MQEISGSSNDKEQKHKLTLGIDKDVIERAKAAGVNISAVTEHLLKAITYQPNGGNTRDDVVKAYDALFKAATDILNQYDTAFEVGRRKRYEEVDGKKVLTEGLLVYYPGPGILDSEWQSYEVGSVLHCLYDPYTLLHKLISALLESAEQNKEKIRELEFALRFVKVLSDENKKNEQ
jgi:hypothetical protein